MAHSLLCVRPGSSYAFNRQSTQRIGLFSTLITKNWPQRTVQVIQRQYTTMDRLPLKRYNVKAQGGRLDIENINVRVQPSAFYNPKFKETDSYDEFNLNENYCDYDKRYADEGDIDGEDKDKDDSGFNPTEKIREYLLDFKQTGVFSCGGVINDLPSSPGIHINDVSILGLPLGEEQAKNIIDKCSMAPYGKNEETIIDTNIRHTWQLDPNQFSIQNSTWESAMQSVVYQISCKLGCNPKFVKHNLYKLLIYGPGSFFKPHRDSEKEEGMFGTLVVILPSLYSGGQLIVKHCENICEYDFSDKNSSLETNYAAFYADCEHEIKPITSGYRACLVYNLINTEPNVMSTAQDNTEIVQGIVKAVNEWSNTEDRCPELLIYGLEHRYTDAGLSFGGLKGKDIAILKLLKAVSNLVPLRIYLINFEKHKSVEINYNEKLTYTGVTAWVSEAGRTNIATAEGVGEENFMVHNRDFVQKDFWEDKPPDSDMTEYTGNQGTNRERFYHHTGIAFWPAQNKHLVFIRDGIYSAIEYVGRLNETSDLQKTLSVIIKKIERSEFEISSFWRLEEIFNIFAKFGTKEQAIALTDIVQERIDSFKIDLIKPRIVEPARFIEPVRKLYKAFPTISTSPSFQSITKDMIKNLKKENEPENKKVITEFESLLNIEPSQGTKRSLEEEANER